MAIKKCSPFKMENGIIVVCLLLMALRCYSQDTGLIEYATIPDAEKSKTYAVRVDGKEVFVEKFKDISYARFAFSGTVKLQVNVLHSFEKYTLSPLSYQIPSKKQGNSVSFILNKPRKLVFKLDGVDEMLFIFADAPEVNIPRLDNANVTNLKDYVTNNIGSALQTKQIQAAIDQVSAKGGGTLFVPNGKYLTGTFVMRKNVILYLESGAIIQGSGDLNDYNDNGDRTGNILEKRGALIYFDKADNARIMGRGVIACQGTKIKTETGQKIRICNIRESDNSGIYDIIIRDSGGFNIHILHSSNVTMQGYKIINDVSLANQDGTDPDGCNGVIVDDVFMYTSDDAIAVKADYRLCENIIVKNCVFWTVKSALKVGSDPYFGARNILFQNNDVVHSDRALALYSGKGPIEDVRFIDNKSEFVGGNAKRQLIVFQVSNSKQNHKEADKRGIGYINNVQVINYTAYQQSQNKSLVSGTIASDGSIHKVSNVLFKNLVIEGKHIMSAKDGNMIVSSAELPKDPNLPVQRTKDAERNTSGANTPVTTENIRFE